MRLILPNIVPNLESYRELPMFFLAGPISGGGDWHREMSKRLEVEVGDCIIVNPSRYTEAHPDWGKCLEGPRGFRYQLDWERHFLKLAGKEWDTGCIVFWLPSEDKDHPRDDGLPYAMDTRGELGEWRGRMMHDPTVRLALGGEEGFPGLKTVVRNFKAAVGSFDAFGTTQEVAALAARIADPSKSFRTRTQA